MPPNSTSELPIDLSKEVKKKVSSEKDQNQEIFPRWIDNPEKKISAKEFESDNAELIKKSKSVVEEIQQLFKDSNPEEYEEIFSGKDANPYLIAQERIQEQGKYSQGDQRVDALNDLVSKKITEANITAPEFLMTTDYLAYQHELSSLSKLSSKNNKSFKRRVARVKKKYGNSAARRAVSSAVSGGEFDNPLFINQDLSEEMSLTDPETSKTGYQNLRALQIVKDRVLDTWDPDARERWAQYDKDRQYVTLEKESRKLDKVLERVLTKDKSTLSRSEQALLADIDEIKKQTVEDSLSHFKGLTPEQGARTIKSIKNWDSTHDVEPYTPTEIKQLALQGLQIRERRASPRTRRELVGISDGQDFDIHYKIFQTNPSSSTEADKPEDSKTEEKSPPVVLEDDKSEKESPETPIKTLTMDDFPDPDNSEHPDSSPYGSPYMPRNEENTSEKDPKIANKSPFQKKITLVGLNPLESEALDIAKIFMEEDQAPGLIARTLSGIRSSKEANGNTLDQAKAGLKGAGEWLADVAQNPGEYLRQSGRNLFKHHFWREWYQHQYEIHSKEALTIAGTYLARESFFVAKEKAQQELYGDGYFTGGELGFTGRLKERSKSPILGSERAVFKRTLSILEEMRANGQIVEHIAHEEANSSILERFTHESDRLIHHLAGEKLHILDSENPVDQELTSGIKSLIHKHLSGESGFQTTGELNEQFQQLVMTSLPKQPEEVRNNLQRIVESDYYASTLVEFTNSFKEHITQLEHEQGISATQDMITNELSDLEIRLGVAKEGARTTQKKTWLEKTPWIGGLLNEFVTGTSVGVALSVLVNYPMVNPRSWVRRGANIFLPVVGGSAIGAVTHGVLERNRLTQELYKHRRDREYGRIFAEDAERRSWFEKHMVPQDTATDLTTKLSRAFFTREGEDQSPRVFNSPDEFRSALTALIDVKTRIKISDSPDNPDSLISYSSHNNLERERTNLDLAVESATNQLTSLVSSNPSLVNSVIGDDTTTDEFISSTGALIEAQYMQGSETLRDSLRESGTELTSSQKSVVDELAPLRSLEEIEKQFERDAMKKTLSQSAKVFAIGIGLGTTISELSHLQETGKLITEGQLPEQVTPLQWLIAETKELNGGGVSDTLESTVIGNSSISLPDNYEIILSEDGFNEIVDKETQQIIVSHVWDQDGTLTIIGEDNLKDAGFDLSRNIYSAQPSHDELIGQHNYFLPDNIQIVDLDQDQQINDLVITLPNAQSGDPSIIIHDAIDPNTGIMTAEATQALQDSNFDISTTSVEIIGSGASTVTEFTINNNGETLRSSLTLPEGITAQDITGDGVPDQLTVTSSGAIIHIQVGPTGQIAFPNPEEFEQAGISFDITQDVQEKITSIASGEQIISVGGQDLQLESTEGTNIIHRMGWWDKGTPGVIEGSELGMNISVTEDGSIRVTQALTDQYVDSSWFDGNLDLQATSNSGQMYVQFQVFDLNHTGSGEGFRVLQFQMNTIGPRGEYIFDVNDPLTQQLFSIENGEAIPHFRLIEVVEHRGTLSDGAILVAPISSQVYDPTNITVTDYTDITSTTLDLPETLSQTTEISLDTEEFLLNKSEIPDIIGPIPIPIKGRRPLERERKPSPGEIPPPPPHTPYYGYIHSGSFTGEGNFYTDIVEVPIKIITIEEKVASKNINQLKGSIRARKKELLSTKSSTRISIIQNEIEILDTRRDVLLKLFKKSKLSSVITSIKLREKKLTSLDPQSEKIPYLALNLEIQTLQERRLELTSNRENALDRWGVLTKQEYQKRRSPKFDQDPDVILDEKTEISEYLTKTEKETPEHWEEVVQLTDQIEKMSDKCRAVITIPIAFEEKNIYRTLEQYKNQIDNQGTKIDKDLFEIVILDNHKKGTKRDKTNLEVERFIKDNPNLNIRYMYKDIDYKDNIIRIGRVRKLLTDAVLNRINHRDSSSGEVIIISNDGDTPTGGVSDEYVFHHIQVYDNRPRLEASTGRIDFPEDSYDQVPLLHVVKRMWHYIDLINRSKSQSNIPFLVGRNSSFRAKTLAAIGGYNEKAKVSEDVEIGDMIIDARKVSKKTGNNADRIQYIHKLSINSDPRRDLVYAIIGRPMAWQYENFEESGNIRGKNWEELVDLAKKKAPLTKDRLQKEINAFWNNWTHGGTRIDRAFPIFNRALGFLGIEYTLDEHNQIMIDDISKLEDDLQTRLQIRSASSVIGEKITSFTRIKSHNPGKHKHGVVALKTVSGEEYIAKEAANEYHRFEEESWALQKVREREITNTPVLIAKDKSHKLLKEDVYIYTKLPGESGKVSETLPSETYREMGKILAKIHQIKTSGIGMIDSQGVGRENSTWKAKLKKFASEPNTSNIQTKQPDDVSTISTYKELLTSMSDEFTEPEPRLIWGDFNMSNILIKNGREITGILDMEHSMSGDPAYDIAWFNLFDGRTENIRENVMKGYESVTPINDDFKHRIRASTIYVAIKQMEFYLSVGNTEQYKALKDRLRVLVPLNITKIIPVSKNEPINPKKDTEQPTKPKTISDQESSTTVSTSELRSKKEKLNTKDKDKKLVTIEEELKRATEGNENSEEVKINGSQLNKYLEGKKFQGGELTKGDITIKNGRLNITNGVVQHPLGRVNFSVSYTDDPTKGLVMEPNSLKLTLPFQLKPVRGNITNALTDIGSFIATELGKEISAGWKINKVGLSDDHLNLDLQKQ